MLVFAYCAFIIKHFLILPFGCSTIGEADWVKAGAWFGATEKNCWGFANWFGERVINNWGWLGVNIGLPQNNPADNSKQTYKTIQMKQLQPRPESMQQIFEIHSKPWLNLISWSKIHGSKVHHIVECSLCLCKKHQTQQTQSMEYKSRRRWYTTPEMQSS